MSDYAFENVQTLGDGLFVDRTPHHGVDFGIADEAAVGKIRRSDNCSVNTVVCGPKIQLGVEPMALRQIPAEVNLVGHPCVLFVERKQAFDCLRIGYPKIGAVDDADFPLNRENALHGRQNMTQSI